MVSRADQTAAEMALRANIRRLLKDRKLTQRAAGADAGMENPDQTMSDFLTGKAKQLDYAYLGPLARALGCELSDLFSPVQDSTGRALPVTPVRSSSSSTKAPGGAADERSEDRLQEQLTTLEKENARLRVRVRAYGEALVELADGKAGEVTKRTPRRRGHRGQTY